jgi:hypothetical protein
VKASKWARSPVEEKISKMTRVLVEGIATYMAGEQALVDFTGISSSWSLGWSFLYKVEHCLGF